MEIRNKILVIVLIFLFGSITIAVPGPGVLPGYAPDKNYGGAWQAVRRTAFNLTMGVGESNRYLPKNTLLSVNYHTMIDCVLAGGYVYTVGLDSMGYYSPDSAGTDTTCLYLDGYVDQFIQVSMFLMGTLADTFFITVEQTIRYDPIMGDSALSYIPAGYDPENSFAYGFVRTDTLFKDYLNATMDSMIVATESRQGESARLFTDWFECIAPGVRLKIDSQHVDTCSTNRMHFELYCRHRNDIIGGASGRRP